MAKIIKGEARGRLGRWIVDFYDAAGRRRWRVCRTKEQAQDVLATVIKESRQPGRPVVDPDITVAAYAEHWLGQLGHLKARTVESARDILRLHLLPAFGQLKVRRLARGPIKEFLGDKLNAGYSKNTVRLLHATLRALLNAAMDDGVVSSNPAARLGRQLRLVTPPSARQEQIKAMTREQLSRFLETARTHSHGYVRRLYPFWFLLGRTGLRLGEALALQWDDIDWTGRTLRVARAFSGSGKSRRLQTPKSGHGRDVDLSAQTVDLLRRLETKRKAETLRRGWPAFPAWVFPDETGQDMDDSNLRKVFARVLKATGLPHFTPHCLRHTFASLLLQHGESPAYVQRQLGHASIKMTVDTYGRWLPMGNTAAVDRLDDAGLGDAAGQPKSAAPRLPVAPRPTNLSVAAAGAAPHLPVAKPGSQPTVEAGEAVANSSKTFGEPWRSRTSNLLIKSQLLCQLS